MRRGHAGIAMPCESDFDGMIVALHDGVFEQPYWSKFLTQIRDLTKAEYASLAFRRADARFGDTTVMKSGSAGVVPEFGDVHELLGKLKMPYDAIEVNRPYSLQEILGIDGERYGDYVQYLTSRDINYAFVVRVTEPAGGNCWLTLGRARRGFVPGTREMLQRIAPHLGSATRVLAALERERMRADVAGDTVRRLNFGWLTFDAEGRVIEIDPATSRLFANTPSLERCRGGEIFPLLRAPKRALQEVLRDFAEARSARPSAFHLVDEPWLDMLVAPISYRAVSGGATPVAIGYVHGVGAVSADRCEQLAQLFGLTANEARLAVALSQGKSIVEAAQELKLSTETARNYSKRVYAKTDTRGQADLVRIILASVIALS